MSAAYKRDVSKKRQRAGNNEASRVTKSLVAVVTTVIIIGLALGLGLGLGLRDRDDDDGDDSSPIVGSASDFAAALQSATFDAVSAIQEPESASRRRRLLMSNYDDVKKKTMMEDATSVVFSFPNNILCALIDKSGVFQASSVPGWNTKSGSVSGRTINSFVDVSDCPYQSASPPPQNWTARATYDDTKLMVYPTGEVEYTAALDVWVDMQGQQGQLAVSAQVNVTGVMYNDGTGAVKYIEMHFDAKSGQNESHVGYVKKRVRDVGADVGAATPDSATVEYAHRWSVSGVTNGSVDDAAVINTNFSTGISDTRATYTDPTQQVRFQDSRTRDGGLTVLIDEQLASGVASSACLNKTAAYEAAYKYNLYNITTGSPEATFGSTLYDMNFTMAGVTDYNGVTVSEQPPNVTYQAKNRDNNINLGCRDARSRAITANYGAFDPDCVGSAYFALWKIPDGTAVTLSGGVGGDPSLGDGKTYKLRSAVTKLIVPLANAAAGACDAMTTDAAQVVPSISSWNSAVAASVGVKPTYPFYVQL